MDIYLFAAKILGMYHKEKKSFNKMYKATSYGVNLAKTILYEIAPWSRK